MKKCPYCKTLNNDDVVMCVNCCHDISSLKPMPDPVNKKFSTQLYIMAFGLLIALGGLIAFFSQRDVYYNYLKLASEATLEEEIKKFNSLASQASFEMTGMMIVSFIGVGMIIVGLILLIKKYRKGK